MVTITTKHYSEKDTELEANAMENVKCREGVCLSTDAKEDLRKVGVYGHD